MVRIEKRWVVLILTCLLARLLPHPANFTGVFGLALYAGSTLRGRRAAWLLPLIPLAIGDLFYGLHALIPVVYLNVIFSTWLGQRISEKRSVAMLVLASFVSAVVFFATTNFGVWWGSAVYPQTLDGLALCYVAAIPFFGNTLASNVFFLLAFKGTEFLSVRRVDTRAVHISR